MESAAAVIAVSKGMAADILVSYPRVPADRVHVIYNGIDTEQYRPDDGRDVLDRFGIDPAAPSVVFVGRVTRQKGLPVLLRAAEWIDPAAQLVLCAGQADTAELQAEVTGLVEHLRASRSGIIWLPGMLAKSEIIQILSHATVFVCPSEYEPLGIVNLEAMACGAAVVASAVGGIPEVVADGQTGLLVPPGDEPALAAAVNTLIAEPAKAAEFGASGRRAGNSRVQLGPKIAAQTADLYAEPSADPDAAAKLRYILTLEARRWSHPASPIPGRARTCPRIRRTCGLATGTGKPSCSDCRTPSPTAGLMTTSSTSAPGLR